MTRSNLIPPERHDRKADRRTDHEPVDASASGQAARPSFRRRLLVTMGSMLAVALTMLGALIWLSLYTWLHVNAYEILDQEMQLIQSAIVRTDGQLHPDWYAWDEPHHRFMGPYVDPFFVQVFDPTHRLIRQSDNITLFPQNAYPERLLATESPGNHLISPLRTFRAGNQLLYYIARPLRNEQGETLGYLQVARTEPGIEPLILRAALVLALGLVVVLLSLGLLIWWQAGRVLRPLATITRATQSISPHQLNQRISVPPEADRETAQLAATMNDQLERLEHAFEEMYRFTANAAHELQTPLTILRGHVEVTLRRLRTPEAYQQTLQVVGQEIDNLTRMVRSLLTLARLDQEAQKLPIETVNLAALIKAEAEPFARGARTKGLDFRLDVPESALVCGQPDLLRQVVANLLDNALKYTAEGSFHIRIHRYGDEVQLTVDDTGIGMAREEVCHATDRFYRASSVDVQNVPGSGLGLALVAQIVARHGGTLRIDSAPGEGTCVCIRLPVGSGPHAS